MYTQEEYEEKRQARYERLIAASRKAQNEASNLTATARDMASIIPFGQPILLGHHSEGRDRSYRNHIENKYRKGYELHKKAEEYRERAEAAASNNAIFSDDPTATDQLAEKIAALEAKQELMKATNKAIKKNSLPALLALGYTEEESTSWLTTPLPYVHGLGYPSYAITNNNANIRRLKERLTIVARKQAAEDKTEEIGGIKIEYAPGENRIRIFYPGRVPLETYKALKQHGFRVLRSEGEGAFSAYYGNNALYFIQQYIKPLQEPEPEQPAGPYWEREEGWGTDGNCLTCGEAGRCRCNHPAKQQPKESAPEFPVVWTPDGMQHTFTAPGEAIQLSLF